MKSRARLNRKYYPRAQWTQPGEPLNNHEPRHGTAKVKRRRKCHCKECCGGNKRIAISYTDDKEWKKEIKFDTEE